MQRSRRRIGFLPLCASYPLCLIRPVEYRSDAVLLIVAHGQFQSQISRDFVPAALRRVSAGTIYNCGQSGLVLRIGNYGQEISGQLLGAGVTSIRLGAPAGTIWTATSTAWTLPSLRTRCTSPQPMSVKLWPVVYVTGVQVGLLAS